MASNDITFILNFVKIGELIQNLNYGTLPETFHPSFWGTKVDWNRKVYCELYEDASLASAEQEFKCTLFRFILLTRFEGFYDVLNIFQVISAVD
jgi:hypothetical protein